jgi:RimJ/RimL family protein N-acetyltransferase/acyl carrier protein
VVTAARATLDAAELYRRLDTLVPGDAAPGTSAIAPPDTELYFERLSLAGLHEMDRYSRDPRLYEFLEYRPFASIDETRQYIERLLAEIGTTPQGRTAMCWFVRRRDDKRLVGTARFVNLSYPRQSADWGYGVDPELWGTGYILQIQELLKHYFFVVLGMNRINGAAMLENRRTIATLLAAGMVHEGTIRDFYMKDGVHHDAWQYGMLASDYFAQTASAPKAARRYSEKDVIGIVASVLTEDEIGPASTNLNTPSWDSLNHMSIMEAVAAKTGLSLSPAQIMRANSISSLLAILNDPR